MRRGYKPKIKQRFSKSIIPGSWPLFESIQGLMKLANVVREAFVDEAEELCHVDYFREHAVQEGI